MKDSFLGEKQERKQSKKKKKTSVSQIPPIKINWITNYSLEFQCHHRLINLLINHIVVFMKMA